MTTRESQNGKPKVALVSASTQTQNNNNKVDSMSPKHAISNESLESVTKMVNNSKIANGPLTQNDITL
jgi:phosphotransacetylase